MSNTNEAIKASLTRHIVSMVDKAGGDTSELEVQISLPDNMPEAEQAMMGAALAQISSRDPMAIEGVVNALLAPMLTLQGTEAADEGTRGRSGFESLGWTGWRLYLSHDDIQMHDNEQLAEKIRSYCSDTGPDESAIGLAMALQLSLVSLQDKGRGVYWHGLWLAPIPLGPFSQ